MIQEKSFPLNTITHETDEKLSKKKFVQNFEKEVVGHNF